VNAQPAQATDVRAGLAAIGERWSRALPPTYAVQAAKAAAIDPSAWPKPATPQPSSGDKPGQADTPSATASVLGGEEFGSVVHLLLESAMRNPQADLAQLARTALAQHELPIDAAGQVLELIDGVRRSEIWARAQASENAMVEVPLLVPGQTPQGLPLVVRAVIDLVFPRDGGWVIVDYKTDRAADGNLDGLAEHYAPQLRSYGRLWQQAAGGQVKELGLLFVRRRKYIKLPNA
jgi:ATP-dependent exoDNAse (exonuclease V) beta subunit